MNEVRVNFLNWRPDQEPSAHDGLQVVDNLYHVDSGYKILKTQTAGAFATATPLGATQTVFRDLQVKVAGPGRDKIFCGLIGSAGGTTVSLHFGVNNTSMTAVASTTMLSAGACRIKSFSIAEFEQYVLLTGLADYEAEGGTTVSLKESVLLSWSNVGDP